MKLAADLHVVLKLSMSGAVPPLICFHCLLRDISFRRVLDAVLLAWRLLCTGAGERAVIVQPSCKAFDLYPIGRQV